MLLVCVICDFYEQNTGISRTPDPASRDEENWVRTHGFGKRRVPGRKVFLP